MSNKKNQGKNCPDNNLNSCATKDNWSQPEAALVYHQGHKHSRTFPFHKRIFIGRMLFLYHTNKLLRSIKE